MNTRKVAIKRKRQNFNRRLSVIIISLAIIAGITVLCGNNSVSAHEDTVQNEQKYYKCIELTSGDTLWDIAEQYMDARYTCVDDYVNELKDINGLKSDNIHEGQFLTVSYYSVN